MKSKHLVILTALDQGHSVKLDDFTLVQGEDNLLYILAHDAFGKEVFLNFHFEVNQFIKMCADLSEEQVAEINANVSLTKYNRSR